ncbi:UDP-Glycosyltransferase superfamily protein [Actinidia rufa]|uniref:UDP-Glycosyltransferase superfamily protein n=1 Tax=Actinidia rufa TaxID=165716 RepID=A0A7J0H528_9ERIC|nr:UDP-Glycosyltransferase superfamily protein [Actinidia rufa]
MGCSSADRIRHHSRVQGGGVAAGGVYTAGCGGREKRAHRASVGPTSGDSVARVGWGVSESLRVELGAGIARPRRADSGVADGGGAILQRQVSGGGDWGFVWRWLGGEAIRDEEGFKGSSTKAMDEFLEAALLMKKTTQLG